MNTKREVESGWWWRRVEQMDGYNPTMWKAGKERAAFAYEMVRRLYRNRNPAPYGELNSDEKLVVDSMLGVSDLNIVMAVHNPPRNTPEPGWTDATPWSWNMRATDNALKEGFIRFIHEQRAKYNIPKPAGRAGQKTHPAAWVWVELMDEAHFKLKSPLNDSDRNTLKKARKIARATGARLSKTLGAITRAAEKAGKTEDAERRFRNLLLLK